MRPLLVALALLLALPASAAPSVRLGTTRVRGAVRVSVPSPVPYGALYLFDGEDVDGQRNASLADGASITRWVNHGTLGDIGDACISAGTATPTLSKDTLNSNRDVLTFDGGDYLRIGDTVDRLTETDTGAFTYWVVVRRNAAANGTSRAFLSATSSGGIAGTNIYFDTTQKAWSFSGSGVGNPWNKTDGQAVTSDAYHLVQLRGDGTTLYLRTDANAEVTQAIGVKSTPGGCRGVVFIGAANNTSSPATPWIGGIAWIGMWNRELLASERTRLHAYLTARYGVP